MHLVKVYALQLNPNWTFCFLGLGGGAESAAVNIS